MQKTQGQSSESNRLTSSNELWGNSETQEKHWNVQGGLDNAADQADQKKLHDMFVIDVDCHQNEPFSLLSKYLPDRWKQNYEKMIVASEGSEDYDPAYANRQIANSGKQKTSFLESVEELRRYQPLSDALSNPTNPKKFDFYMDGRIQRPEVVGFRSEMNPESVIDTFVNRMKDIGIQRSIIYPGALLSVGHHPNLDFEVAISNAYTDYMIDTFLDKYPEILSPVVIPANSPDKSAELIDRVGSEKGIIGVMISAFRPTLAGEESWNPIYEAAERKNIPICFHASESYLPPYNRLKNLLAFHSLGFPINMILQLTSLVTEGVPERFPNLKFVFIEGGITWIPWVMFRLDSVYAMRRSEAPLLKKPPSEYIKQFYYSSQPLERPQKKSDLEWVFKSFNAETQLMYASDYPHFDFDTPGVIYDLPFLTPEAKKSILSENARKLFRIN
jgi:predicted TIM-barrel fold metal-dependent hydrolase